MDVSSPEALHRPMTLDNYGANIRIVNDARAMRVAEVMNHFRDLQHRLAQYNITAPTEYRDETGYKVLREAHVEAQAALAASMPGGSLDVPASPSEQTKRLLQRVLLDANARRFRVLKAFLRAAAAVRWHNRRVEILRKPPVGRAQALRGADDALKAVRW